MKDPGKSDNAAVSYSLTSVQEGMLFHRLQAPQSGVDLEQLVATLREPVDAAALAAAWRSVVALHPALRTRFRWDGLDKPVQEVMPAVELSLDEQDWSGLAPAEQKEKLDTFLYEDRVAELDLSRAPLLRLRLLRLGAEDYRLVWTFPHLLLDGGSFALVLRDLFAAYEAHRRGEPPMLVAPRAYADHLGFLERELPRNAERAREHFTALLAGFARANPLVDRVAVSSGIPARLADRVFGEVEGSLSTELTTTLRELAKARGFTLNTFVQAAWALVVSDFSGEDDVVFGAVRACRRSALPEAPDMVGLFINTLPLRVRVNGQRPAAAVLEDLRAGSLTLREFEHTPLLDVQAASAVSPGTPLFESIIVYNDELVSSRLAKLGDGFARRAFTWIEQTNFPLTLFAYGEPALLLHLSFDPGKITEERARSMLARVTAALEAFAAGVDRPLVELMRVPAPELAALARLDQTGRPFVDQCVHAQFEAQVDRTPDAPAVVFRNEVLSYRELDERANRLARALLARGAGPDTLVGIFIERSVSMMVGLLGILKAGAAYVPLDPHYPEGRIGVMLEESQLTTVVTTAELAGRLPASVKERVLVDSGVLLTGDATRPGAAVTPQNLAYVIFTSGSTGRPKGVMVQHRNVANFFVGMDERIGTEPGVWLAVTSISFDISVLELFWTLSRGFKVVIQPEADRAALAKSRATPVRASAGSMGFGIFYFASDLKSSSVGDAYRLMLEGAKFADSHDFCAVWTPERHFHAFGGVYPNPAVTTAALAVVTKNVELRAGSVVLPLHDPIRVAEDWAVIDNLSGGRVGLSFASGWHANDFALMPQNYARRKEVMLESIATVLRLWNGEKLVTKNGEGKDIEISVLPRPVRARPPIWLASAGSVDTFAAAGRHGYNVLTNMLGQDVNDLRVKFAAYREARREAGHAGNGTISVMLHTFVCGSDEEARDRARKPFGTYLASSYDLVKVAPWMFPAFRQPSKAGGESKFDPSTFDEEDKAALLDFAFDRYFDTAGLFGTPERALRLVEQLKDIGATEVACLIDFGIDTNIVLDNLTHLDALRRLANPSAAQVSLPAENEDWGVEAQIQRHGVTHLQCTPSYARMLIAQGALPALRSVRRLMLGGEALPPDLAKSLCEAVGGAVLNMYGPTETTIWSTVDGVRAGEPVTIGSPIVNTVVRILDSQLRLVPPGVVGELYLGGEGVTRGYLRRPDLTSERFIADPFKAGERLYRTGDFARLRADGRIDFLGRGDQQVKLNGYRIELGEIEAVLGRHPSVQESAVVVRSDGGVAELTAYVVPRAASNGAAASAEDPTRVASWQALWNQAYAAGVGQDPRFNTAGWNSSYDGSPVPLEAMREWRDGAVQALLEWGASEPPRRVLEIGCGTGMILYAALPKVEHYTGLDVSSTALELIRTELRPEEQGKVTLLERAADALDGIPDASVDAVIINSVIQYFPGVEYLLRVLRHATRVVREGGRVVVGDVRSLEHLALFHTRVELERAPVSRTAAEMGQAVQDRVRRDGELALSPRFFSALERELPRIAGVSLRLKPGRHPSEMTDFRYDVCIRVGESKSPVVTLPASTPGARTLDGVRELLTAKPSLLWLRDLPNARVAGAVLASELVAQGGALSAADIRQRSLSPSPVGIDPAALAELDSDYEAEVRFSEDAARFDALLRRRGAVTGTWPLPEAGGVPLSQLANRAQAPSKDEASLVQSLRAHLRAELPEYMVPATFVTLDRFPVTPNGKLDRAALPAPERLGKRMAAGHVNPTSDLERLIADVWQGVLGATAISVKTNVFDLGANSLLTVEANARLSEKLGQKIPLVTMFRYPSIEALARALGATQAAAPEEQQRLQGQQDRRMDAAERRRAARAKLG